MGAPGFAAPEAAADAPASADTVDQMDDDGSPDVEETHVEAAPAAPVEPAPAPPVAAAAPAPASPATPDHADPDPQ
jgi:hypothetical protein